MMAAPRNRNDAAGHTAVHKIPATALAAKFAAACAVASSPNAEPRRVAGARGGDGGRLGGLAPADPEPCQDEPGREQPRLAGTGREDAIPGREADRPDSQHPDGVKPVAVPGLLQTEGYARAVIGAGKPGVDAEEIGRRVQLRIERQVLIRRPLVPLELRVVVNESILRRQVGGREVMAGQLDALADVAGLPNVLLRVVPFSAGLHQGMMTGPFVILRFPANGDGTDSEPPTVYVDGYTGDLYLDKPAEVTQYADAFEAIWNAALNEAASSALIQASAKELSRR